MGEYKLSTTLFGHSLDVRSLSVTPDNSIISGSRDKTAKFWKITGFTTSNYTEVMTYKDQKNFVASVLYLEPSIEFPEGLVVTGGNDNIILIYNPGEPFSTYSLKDHKNVVCCLSKGIESNTFVSGSWDNTSKFWSITKTQSPLVTYTGHEAAIWGVIQLCDKRIVTASADKTLRIWSEEGQQLKVLQGHTDCVRAVADFPEMKCFISVSNDASIKIWSYLNGDCVQTLYGHTNYIYSIARCKFNGDNCFVTSDEDYTVRYWNNGENTQVIKLPAQSIWCVDCLNNGDIVTGSSDGLVRVFTQDSSRIADEPALKKFNEEVEAINKQTMQEIGGYKVSDLPGREALYDPGKKAGQMKMIREPQGVVAYTWVEDGDNSHWEKVGDVLGGTDKDSDGKTMYEGQPYDFVFSVDVEDGKPPIKLPFNKGDDPYMAAHKFLEKNMLPAAYLDQVVDFILKNSKIEAPTLNNEYVDPFTGGSRYTPNTSSSGQNYSGLNADPFTGGSSYSTGVTNGTVSASSAGRNSSDNLFSQNTYRSFEMGDPKVILGKLVEFNNKHNNAYTIEDNLLESIADVCVGPGKSSAVFEVLFKLLEWPEDIIFPVLDVVRLAVRYKENNAILSTMKNGLLIEKLNRYVSQNCTILNTTIVSLRTLTNLCLHEPGEKLVLENKFDILENITTLANLNKNAEIGLSTLLLNITIGSIKFKDDLAMSVLADVLPDIQSKLKDSEAQFRGYVALGTLLTFSCSKELAEVKMKIKTNASFIGKLQEHALSATNELEIKKMNCARNIQDLISNS